MPWQSMPQRRPIRRRRSRAIKKVLLKDGGKAGLAEFVRIASDAHIGVYASSGAFYLFLALFPTAALVCSLLPLLPFTQEELLEYLSTVMPDFVQSLLGSIIQETYAYSAAAFSISVVALVWSAGRAFIGLIRGLNRIYSGDRRNTFLRLRGIGSLYLLIFLAAMLLTLGLSLFQKTLLEQLIRRWPQMKGAAERFLRFRFLPGMLLLAVYFTGLYKFLPAGKRRFFRQTPGALLAAALWMLFSRLFSLYMHRFGASSVYGSLATVAFALMWIYYCNSVTLLGGCFNVWLTGMRPSAADGTEKEKTEKNGDSVDNQAKRI